MRRGRLVYENFVLDLSNYLVISQLHLFPSLAGYPLFVSSSCDINQVISLGLSEAEKFLGIKEASQFTAS